VGTAFGMILQQEGDKVVVDWVGVDSAAVAGGGVVIIVFNGKEIFRVKRLIFCTMRKRQAVCVIS
jgi:hypothetical protein